MQRGGHCAGHYNHDDQIRAPSGSLGPLNSGAFLRNVGGYNILLQGPCTHQSVGYNEDLLRDIMLKHEAIFKYQICELHHLYKRQRELMGDLRMQNMPANGLVSPLQSDISHTALQHVPCRLLSNSTDVEPRTQGLEIFPNPTTFVSGNRIQMGSDLCIARNNFKELETSSTREQHNFRKRLPDIKLPATQLMDFDEGECFEEKRVFKSHSVLHDPSGDNSDSSNKISIVSSNGSSTAMNLSCQRMNCVFDLNEPVQVDETTNSLNSVFCNMTCEETIHQDHDPSGSSRLKSSVLNEIDHSIPEHKGGERISLTSGLQRSFFRQLPLLYNYNVGLSSETARNAEDLIDFNRHRVFTSSMTNSSPPDPLSSDINTAAFDETSRIATLGIGIRMEYLVPDVNDATSPSLGSATTFHVNCSTENQYTNENHSISSNLRNLDCTKSRMDLNLNVVPSCPETEASQEKVNFSDGLGNLDLNVVPYNNLLETEVFQEKAESIDCNSSHGSSIMQQNEIGDKQDCDCKMVVRPISLESLSSSSSLSVRTSITSPSSSSVTEDIPNCKQTKIPAGVMPCISSHESEKCNKDDIYLGSQSGKESSRDETCMPLPFAFTEELLQIPAVANGGEIDIQVPQGQDKEPSPPREELEKNQSKLDESIEGLDRIAAEIIISMSLSGKQQFHKNCISGPYKASVNCLDWFAEIVSSGSASLENEFDVTLSDKPVGNCNQLFRNSLKHCEAKILKSIRTVVGGTFSETSDRKGKIVSVLALPCQHPRRIRAKNAREQKKTQAETSPKSIAVAARNANEIVRGRRMVSKTSQARGKKMSSKNFPKVSGKRKCDITKQQRHTDEIEQGFTENWLFAWGKKNRRQKHRRATKWGIVS